MVDAAPVTKLGRPRYVGAHPAFTLLFGAVAFVFTFALCVVLHAISPLLLARGDSASLGGLPAGLSRALVAKPWLGAAVGLLGGLVMSIAAKRRVRRNMDALIAVRSGDKAARRASREGISLGSTIPLAVLGFVCYAAGASVLAALTATFISYPLMWPEHRRLFNGVVTRVAESRGVAERILRRRARTVVAATASVFLVASVALLGSVGKARHALDETRLFALVELGGRLSAPEANGLEARAAKHEDDLESRAMLLGYYASGRSAEREKLVLWLIQHRPKARILAMREAQFPSIESNAYQDARDLWLTKLRELDHDPDAAINAAYFFARNEPELSVSVLEAAADKHKNDKELFEQLMQFQEFVSRRRQSPGGDDERDAPMQTPLLDRLGNLTPPD